MALIKCPDCGNQISDRALRCPNCGYPMKEQEKKCPECGETVSENDFKCPNCGYPIRAKEGKLQEKNVLSETTENKQNKTTDMWALICFGAGLCSLKFFPIVFVPITIIANIVSYQRLKENPNLTGQAYRIIGAICGVISIIYYFWIINYIT